MRKRKLFVKVDRAAPYQASFTDHQGSDGDHITFTFDELYDIIEFDLDNTYATIGNQIFKQDEGCPMGGLLSAFYGNNTCAYYENLFLEQSKMDTRIWGIRQMDDLTLFSIHDTSNDECENEIKQLCLTVEHNLYRGGLEAEIQEPDFEDEHSYVIKFAGHKIHANKDLSDIYTTTLNENVPHIYTHGKQKKTRYPSKNTYINEHIKIGNIIGSVHRTRGQNTYRSDFTIAMRDMITELRIIGYTNNTIKKCLYRLARQVVPRHGGRPDEWKIMLEDNLNILLKNQRNPIHAPRLVYTTPKKPAKKPDGFSET
jgi:hypothetical protein